MREGELSELSARLCTRSKPKTVHAPLLIISHATLSQTRPPSLTDVAALTASELTLNLTRFWDRVSQSVRLDEKTPF